jgi:hypothetical protein
MIAGMTALPQPDDLAGLILRTDFSDDAAWRRVRELYGEDGATYVSDPAYAGATIADLIAADASATDDEKVNDLFLADGVTMTGDGHPLLAVDLSAEPGRTFRVLPDGYADVAANLSIANMDFAEFADAADDTGTYRGFPEP